LKKPLRALLPISLKEDSLQNPDNTGSTFPPELHHITGKKKSYGQGKKGVYSFYRMRGEVPSGLKEEAAGGLHAAGMMLVACQEEGHC